LKVRGVFLIEILMENGRMENLVDELFWPTFIIFGKKRKIGKIDKKGKSSKIPD
jgi:hypothetical protein